MPRPSPRLAPVTRTVRAALAIAPRQFAGGRDIERRHDRDGSGNLVKRQSFAAKRQYVVLDLQLAARARAIGFQHDVGNHDRAGDGIFLWPHQRHSYLWVPVDDRLDLLGVNLQASDIDDAAAPAGEDVAIAAPLHHIAGIDETVAVAQHMLRAEIALRRARRADTQRAIDEFKFDAIAVVIQEIGGKPGAAVVDLEGNAGFRRRIGVADSRLGERGAQTVEDRLVGDFTGEADIARRYLSDLRRHQRAAPVRRRAG